MKKFFYCTAEYHLEVLQIKTYFTVRYEIILLPSTYCWKLGFIHRYINKQCIKHHMAWQQSGFPNLYLFICKTDYVIHTKCNNYVRYAFGLQQLLSVPSRISYLLITINVFWIIFCALLDHLVSFIRKSAFQSSRLVKILGTLHQRLQGSELEVRLFNLGYQFLVLCWEFT